MSKDIRICLTQAEVAHLFRLLKENEDEGTYYGPREQYWNRHERLLLKLDKGRIGVRGEKA